MEGGGGVFSGVGAPPSVLPAHVKKLGEGLSLSSDLISSAGCCCLLLCARLVLELTVFYADSVVALETVPSPQGWLSTFLPF